MLGSIRRRISYFVLMSAGSHLDADDGVRAEIAAGLHLHQLQQDLTD